MDREPIVKADWTVRVGVVFALFGGTFALVAPYIHDAIATKSPERKPPIIDTSARQLRELELQKMCADQALKVFQTDSSPRKPNVVNSYTSHYNKKLSKCFMLSHTYDASDIKNTGTTTADDLSDAFDGLLYAELFKTYDRTLPFEAHVFACNLMPPDAPERKCKSENEWKSYVHHYMESYQ